MLVEEIHVCRKSVAETAQIPVTVRAERAEVQREPAPEATKARES
jgi:stress response protein YsnF